MCSPSLELGKREGQLPFLQVPTAHWAQQPWWVLELTKSTEHNKWISKCKKWLHSSEKGWCHHLYKPNQPRTNNQTSIIQYKLWKQILCEASQRQDLPPAQLFLTSTAPTAGRTKTFANHDPQEKYIQWQEGQIFQDTQLEVWLLAQSRKAQQKDTSPSRRRENKD